MTTATLKEATEKLGISLDDKVHYQARGNRAIIQIDLKIPAPDNFETPQPQHTLTPEEEFRQKYPHIKINRPELFKLVGSMAPSTRSDKDELIDILEEKYL